MKLGKTYISRTMPWGMNRRNGHRVLCGDGKIRAVELAPTADTFFSIPARMRYKGKWISGYVTTHGLWFTQEKVEKVVWTFRAHVGQDAPYWPDFTEPTMPYGQARDEKEFANAMAIMGDAF